MPRRTLSFFIGIILLPILIFLANLYLVSPLFAGEYTQWIGSIETAFIAQAKFVVEHFPHLSFFPYWYAGFPFHLFHTPMLVTSMALLSKIAPAVSIPSSYRIVTATAYCLVPVSVYFLGRKIGKSSLAGLLASLLYSFWPSASIATSIVSNPGNIFKNIPWRFTILTYYGEGPHTLSLVFLPLAALFFWRAITTSSKKCIIFSAVFISLCGMASTFGLIALVLLISAMTLIKSFTTQNWFTLLKRTFLVLLISAGLSSFWYNISFIRNLFAFSNASLNFLSGNFTLIFFTLVLSPILILALHFIFKNTPLSQNGGLSSLLVWVLGLFLIIMIWEKTGVALLPQTIRFTAEFDLGTALIAGLIFGKTLDYSYKKGFLGKITSFFLMIVFIGLSAFFYLKFLPKMRSATKPHPDITQTVEYKIANVVSNITDKRAYLSGNYSFWLNTFVKTPQLRGGGDQSIVNPWIKHAIYQINTGSDGEIALYWLKIFNVDSVVVNLPSSPNPFKDFKLPEKFKILGKPVYEKHSDLIYRVPLKDPSMTKVVSLKKMGSLETPTSAIDKKPIKRYVDWLEEAQKEKAKLEAIDNTHYQINAKIDSKEAVLVHFSYDPGWKAKSDNGPIKVEKGPLGQTLLVPVKTGAHKIKLHHSFSFNQLFGYAITISTIVFLGINCIKNTVNNKKELSATDNSS